MSVDDSDDSSRENHSNHDDHDDDDEQIDLENPTHDAARKTRASIPAEFRPERMLAAVADPTVDDLAELTDREKAKLVLDRVIGHSDVNVVAVDPNGRLYRCDDNVWTARSAEQFFRKIGRSALGDQYGKHVREEMQEQHRGTAAIPESRLGLEPGQLAVRNGLLELDADGGPELRPLRPGHFALTQLPVEYDPDATYDEWQSYVEEWAEPGKADALQEYVGYCLDVGAMPFARAMLLVGTGANGKGTFLQVVRALLGEENTTSIDIQTLAAEEYARAEFHAALANIDDDLTSESLDKGIGLLKRMLAGERIRGRQIWQEAIEFHATGKHLYAANRVPDVDVADDDGFWRRWLLIEFPNHYPPDERDHTLEDRLTEPEMLSGILNWAIEGRERLLEQGHFTNELLDDDEKRRRWKQWGNSLCRYDVACVRRDPDADRVTTRQAYERYVDWCERRDLEPKSQSAFTSYFKEKGLGYRDSLRVDSGVRRGYDAFGHNEEVMAE